MGNGSLSAAIADILSSTNVRILTCDEIAISVKPKIGYMPSNSTVSKIMGQRSDWRKMITPGGKTAFQRSV